MFWRKLRYLLPWVRRAQERDMQEELRALQDIAGAKELGNLTLAAEDARAAYSWAWLDHLQQDLAYAGRSMRRNKLFTALVVTSIGLAGGLVLSVVIARYAKTLLYGIEPTDPAAMTLAVTALIAAGLVAVLIPARRTTHIDPLAAVREEN